ncbi:hypothetical protein [uncultured Duncaniella sp.]|uniref:hypothetical protein n=1 Tax=uncultured Duncaniella sp. TaxID=2768039 RepID=UPI002628D3B2|nr:hypothetical protein [uncultured Duncaniella sp.]
MQTLTYSDAIDELDEYDKYLDMDEDSFQKAGEEELNDWQFEWVSEIRRAIALPEHIETPPSRKRYNWMEDFTNLHNNKRFVNDAIYALNAKHPFQRFKAAVHSHSLIKEWSAFELERCEQYVAQELTICGVESRDIIAHELEI